jgi:hypothetical protein
LANGFSFVAAEIVHHNDIAGFEAGHKKRPHIGEESQAIDRTIEDARRLDAIAA